MYNPLNKSKQHHILTINSSFPELEHLASELALKKLLSYHVRPYANKGRNWERALSKFPYLGHAYQRTIGRRSLISEFPTNRVKEKGIFFDILMALAIRIQFYQHIFRPLYTCFSHARTSLIARSGSKILCEEDSVVASWGVAEPAFKNIKKRGGFCVLNYSFAHHAFARSFLLNEAEREPFFANTLNIFDWPRWFIDRLNNEIDMADKIFVGSSFVQQSFLSQNIAKNKIVVLPYGVDTCLFTPINSLFQNKKSFRLLFVGQIGQRKGISYLLRAFKRFTGDGVFLTLVGRFQGDRNTFSPWTSIFKHINHCPHSELIKIYQNHDIFIFPTLLEGMPLVILEAMSSGLPVITTPNGPSDVVRNGVDGFIVPPRDEDAILDCLELLRRDPDLRIWMGQNARKRALEFTWSTYRIKALKFMQELLK